MIGPDGKFYLSPSELFSGSFELAKKVQESDFTPDLLVGIWRGGSPMAIAVHSYLEEKCGLKVDHFPLRASSYSNDKQGSITIYPNELLNSMINSDTNLLLVDDVFDTGKTIEALINYFKPKVKEVKSATLFYKPKKNKTKITPDFYLWESDEWIIFPHDNFDKVNF